ncbi:MAG: tail fiber domain-containing protein [Bacteroidota bacterium]|nr:tail fiber domain-containing protein [Bacteroidota bacterium]
MKKNQFLKKISALIIAGTIGSYEINAQTHGAGAINTANSVGTVGTWHCFIGSGTGASNTGGYNSFLGEYAGGANTSGANNTFTGFEAGRTSTVGGNNTFNGYQAGYSNGSSYATGGHNHTFIGYRAGYTTGTNDTEGISVQNTFVGSSSGFSNTVGGRNTFLGYTAGYSNTTSFDNTFLGDHAGYATTTGANNAFSGSSSGRSNTTGANNVFMGYRAGYTNATGGSNVTIGSSAGYSNTNSSIVAIGANALYSNTAFGIVGIGASALYSNTSGTANVAIGYGALTANTTASYNTACGYQVLIASTGNYNTGSGAWALNKNTSGSSNTAHGMEALYNTTSGYNNTGCGFSALLTNTTGYQNTAVGYLADVSTSGLNNATAIGNGAIVNASNKVRIGNTYATMVIEGQTAWTYPSDGRFKSNITENVKGLEFIKKLRPVNYKFNTQTFDQFLMQNMTDSIKALRTNGVDYTASSSVIHTGFIAQEVEQAANACGYIFDGLHVPVDTNDNYSLGYSQFVVPLVKAVQELSKAADSTSTATAKNDSINDAKMQAMQNKINQLDAIINSCCTVGKSMQQNNSNSESLANSKDVELSNKNIVVLDQNTPNPFADQTLINYFLPDNITRAQIIFLDQSGKLIKAVDLTEKGKGSLNVFANDLTSGIYTYSLIVDGQTIETKKMVKTK